MKKAAACLLAVLATTAQAENYVGGNMAFVDYDSDASLKAIVGRLGMTFGENLAGEVRLGKGYGTDTIDVSGYNVKVELETMYGVYGRFNMAVSSRAYPYVIAGYTRGKVKASISGIGSSTDTEGDLSYGFGLDYHVNEKLTINGEYMQYLDKSGADISALSIGVSTRF